MGGNFPVFFPYSGATKDNYPQRKKYNSLIINVAMLPFIARNGGGGGNRTRVRKSSTGGSTYLAKSFYLT